MDQQSRPLAPVNSAALSGFCVETQVPSHVSVCLPMRDVPKSWRSRLRKLSMGSVEGAMVRWSYHDGSTWTTILFAGKRRDPNAIIGWAVFTLQEARHPIIGVYVDKRHRKQGHATKLVNRLLDECGHRVPHGRIYAVSDWWPKYTELIASAGFKQVDWD